MTVGQLLELPANEILPIDGGEKTVRMIRWILDSPPAPLYAHFGGFTENIDRWQYAEAMVPSFNTVRVGCLPAGCGAKPGDHIVRVV